MKNNNTENSNLNLIQEEQQKLTVWQALGEIALAMSFLVLGAFSTETENIAKDEVTTEIIMEETTETENITYDEATIEVTTEEITEETTEEEILNVAHAASWEGFFCMYEEGCFYITADGEKIYSSSNTYMYSKDALKHPIYIWPEDSKDFKIYFSSEKYPSKDIVVDKTGFYDYACGTVFIEFEN